MSSPERRGFKLVTPDTKNAAPRWIWLDESAYVPPTDAGEKARGSRSETGESVNPWKAELEQLQELVRKDNAFKDGLITKIVDLHEDIDILRTSGM